MNSGTSLGGGQIGFSTIFFKELQLTRSNGWALQYTSYIITPKDQMSSASEKVESVTIYGLK